MENFVWIVVLIIWFIYSAVTKNRKDQQKKQNPKPIITSEPQEYKKPQTFKEVFEEMRKQIQQQQDLPADKPLKPVFQQHKKPGHQVTNQQVVFQDHDYITDEERKKADEYKEFVAKQRQKKYVTVVDDTDDDPQVTMIEDQEVVPLSYDLDLKNIVIADMIMRRPEY